MFAEKRYDDRHARKEREIGRELIMLTLVKTIFECAIEKMELAAALSSLMLNPEVSVILTTDQINIKNDDFLCNIKFSPKYLLQSTYINEEDLNICPKETWDNTIKFEAVFKVFKIFDKHIDVLHSSSLYKHTSMTLALFLHHIRYFLQHVVNRLYFTPEQERSKKLHYRKLWHLKKKSIEEVASSTMDLERQRINHKKTLKDIVKRYKKNIVAIDGIDKRCNEYVTNTNMRYEKKQIAVYKIWEYEQNETQSALKNIIDDLESLKDINTKLEQVIRKRKLITESKLLAIMTKYDTEIGNKCRMLESLSQIYEYEKQGKYDLEVIFLYMYNLCILRACICKKIIS
ncbi:uncharacterized protein LOC118644731 isoform X2 [Monomorium pharaonis]|uniref:uncharacterized protein LOC118644731 isoform X2 n=1 Tax=Monomorium pharaonis TaxID=307658 RepID=UPI00174755F3|nr:uncharacterized protein LOC118644731 isoform X2 [Monomorium pharaonis]